MITSSAVGQSDDRDLDIEKSAVLNEIREAFAGVSREGAVSWGQSIEMHVAHEKWIEDNAVYDTPEIHALQRAIEELDAPEPQKQYRPFHDLDEAWSDLVNDADWEPNPDFGGFSFLYPVSRRYYLAAAMLRSLANPDEDKVGYALTVPDFERDLPITDVDWRGCFLLKWSALDHRQRLCVKRFLEFQLADKGR